MAQIVTVIINIGPAGASAYQIAVANGFVGTVEQWQASLKGAKGDTGNTGAAGPQGAAGAKGDKGDTGNPGADGLTAAGVRAVVLTGLDTTTGGSLEPTDSILGAMNKLGAYANEHSDALLFRYQTRSVATDADKLDDVWVGYPAIVQIEDEGNRLEAYSGFGEIVDPTNWRDISNRDALRFPIAQMATIPGFLDGSGNANTDGNYLHSNYIPCGAGDRFFYSVRSYIGMPVIAFYDTGKTFISAINGTSASVDSAGSATAPANTGFCVISFGKPGTAGAPPGQVNTVTMILAAATVRQQVIVPQPLPAMGAMGRRKFVFSTGQFYGTSISSTDYPWLVQHMEDLTGATWHNDGWSGNTPEQLATNTRMQRIFDRDADLIILELGANTGGTPGSVGTFDGSVPGEPIVTPTNIAADFPSSGTKYIQAVDHIVRKLKAEYYDIRARAGLTGSENEATRQAMIAAVTPQPLICILGALPQQRGYAANPISQPVNWNRKRLAEMEVCARHGVQFLDVTFSLGVDMTKEPWWEFPTDTTNNYGVMTMDGLHWNYFGCRRISERICAEIGI